MMHEQSHHLHHLVSECCSDEIKINDRVRHPVNIIPAAADSVSQSQTISLFNASCVIRHSRLVPASTQTQCAPTEASARASSRDRCDQPPIWAPIDHLRTLDSHSRDAAKVKKRIIGIPSALLCSWYYWEMRLIDAVCLRLSVLFSYQRPFLYLRFTGGLCFGGVRHASGTRNSLLMPNSGGGQRRNPAGYRRNDGPLKF